MCIQHPQTDRPRYTTVAIRHILHRCDAASVNGESGVLAFALSSVGVEFVADVAAALKSAERVDTLVMTAVRVRRTLVKLCTHHTRTGSARYRRSTCIQRGTVLRCDRS